MFGATRLYLDIFLYTSPYQVEVSTSVIARQPALARVHLSPQLYKEKDFY